MAKKKPQTTLSRVLRLLLLAGLVLVGSVMLIVGIWLVSKQLHLAREHYQLQKEAARIHLSDAKVSNVVYDNVQVGECSEFFCIGPTNPELQGTYSLPQTTLGTGMAAVLQRLKAAGYTVNYSPTDLSDVHAISNDFHINVYLTYQGTGANNNNATPVDGIHIMLQNTAVKDY